MRSSAELARTHQSGPLAVTGAFPNLLSLCAQAIRRLPTASSQAPTTSVPHSAQATSHRRQRSRRSWERWQSAVLLQVERIS